MKRIALTNGGFTLVDNEDYEALSKFKWSRSSYGYAYSWGMDAQRGHSRTILLHRHLLQVSRGLITDHINHDKLDNRRENLRVCTYAENGRNRAKLQRNNTTGYVGVYRHGRRFTVQIRVYGKRLCLGTYGTPEEAAHVYNEAARDHFGQFAFLNVLPEHYYL